MAIKHGISFLYDFVLGNRNVENPGQNIISVTSQAVGDFDKANLFIDSTRRRWRSSNVLTEQQIVIKTDIEKEIDTFAILGHNFTPSAVVRIEANFNNEFTAPPFSQVVPVDEDTENLILANDGFGAAYNYFRIRILDPGNPCGYVEMGRVVGGEAFTYQNNEDITDDYRVINNDESETMKTQGYFRASNENVVVREFSANFQKIKTELPDNQNFIQFRRMFKSLKTTRPFLMVLDRDNPNVLNMWCQFTKLPDFAYTVNRFVNYPIRIEEVF